jgi:hypothetical protein
MSESIQVPPLEILNFSGGTFILKVFKIWQRNYVLKIYNEIHKIHSIIIFSAATPNQGGQNHLNEQEPNYWQKLFEKHGYNPFDIIRPLIWHNNIIDWWYRQNIVVYSSKKINFTSDSIPYLIHPSNFDQKIQYLKKNTYDFNIVNEKLLKIERGGAGLRFYFGCLKKSFFAYIKKHVEKKLSPINLSQFFD